MPRLPKLSPGAPLVPARRLPRAGGSRRGAAALGLAAASVLGGACNDGSLPFGSLGQEPIIPGVQGAAVTSPVDGFTAEGAAFPLPPGGFGAEGPQGLVIVPSDDGENQFQQNQIEEGDALVCDPSNNRVVLLKARAHVQGQPPAALVFATVAGARGVAFGEAGGARRALVASATGYAVLGANGALLSAQTVAGAPFAEIAFVVTADGPIIFLGGGTDGGQIVRLVVSNDGNFTPSGDPSQFAPTGSATLLFAGADLDGVAGLDPIRGLALGPNDFLFFTAGDRLRRLAEASAPEVTSANAIVQDVGAPFAAGETPGGIAVNSETNTLVAVGGTGARIDEVDVTQGVVATLPVNGPARDVALDGLHSAVFWLGGGAPRPQIEDAPDLGTRLQPIWEARGCVGCHPVVFPELDLTSADTALDTLVGAGGDISCNNTVPPGSKRVIAGNPDGSFLVLRITVPPSPACSVRMPQGNRPVPSVEIDTIKRWIAAGANPAAGAP